MSFSNMNDGRKGEFELLSLTYIAPDVTLVNVSSKISGAVNNGKDLETRLARGTWVLVQRNDTLLIAAMRGFPAVGEQRTRPGVDR